MNNRFTAEAREAAQRRLRRLTAGSALLSATAVAGLAGISWATLPGTTTNPPVAAGSTSTAGSTASTATATSAPAPAATPAAVQPTAAPATSSSHAVTGGSR
jgi:hypothetical protein